MCILEKMLLECWINIVQVHDATSSHIHYAFSLEIRTALRKPPFDVSFGTSPSAPLSSTETFFSERHQVTGSNTAMEQAKKSLLKILRPGSIVDFDFTQAGPVINSSVRNALENAAYDSRFSFMAPCE